MKITQITYTARKGMPAYSHEEIVAVAMIADGMDQAEQITQVKRTVDAILHGTVSAPVITQTVVENGQTVINNERVEAPANTPAVSETPANTGKTEEKKGKRTATRGKEEAAQTEATIGGKSVEEIRAEEASKLEVEKAQKLIAEEAAKKAKEEAKNVENYDRSIKEHTSTFASFLNKNYGDTWKTKEGLKKFSEDLSGKPFRDTKTGNLVPSFIAEITKFFGSTADVL